MRIFWLEFFKNRLIKRVVLSFKMRIATKFRMIFFFKFVHCGIAGNGGSAEKLSSSLRYHLRNTKAVRDV